MTPAARRWLSLALRAAVGLLLVALAARFLGRQELRLVVAVVHDADGALALLACTLGLTIGVSRAARDRLLLLPTRRLPTLRLTRYFFASYAADNLLMGQAGLGVRVALLAADGVPTLTGVGLQVLDKLLEALSLLLVCAPLLSSLPELRLQQAWPVGALVLVAIPALAYLARRRPDAVARLIAAAAALRSPRLAAGVAALSLAGALAEVGSTVLLLRALHLPSTLATAALVVLSANASLLIPGLPANLGTFEAATVLALVSVGVARAPALGFALAFHAMRTIPATLIGLPDLVRKLRRPRAPSETDPRGDGAGLRDRR